MKSISILLVLMLSATFIFAQRECKRITVHAFTRNAVPGMMPRGEAREDGSTVARPIKPVTNYEVYLENPAAKAQVTAIYIDGTAYKATWELVQSPVIIQGGQVGQYQSNDTIINKTSNKVYKLLIGDRLENPTSKLAEMSKSNAVVVELVSGKKKYYSYSAEWKKLKPVVLQ